MNKFSKALTWLGTIAAIISTILSVVLLIADSDTNENNRTVIFAVVGLAILLEITVLFVIRYYLYRKEANDDFEQSATYINKLIKYNRQREEIEEEIRVLMKQLENSSVAQYLDINRLAFSGQSGNVVSTSIDYENFLRQFGLEKEKLEIRTGTAAFLTPFDSQGNRLFHTCQAILGKVDIFLRKTDNLVEKDDILMNIVAMIVQSEFVIVNIDGRNPNVYYELGIAHALGKPTILLSRARYDISDIGFDIRQKRIIIYADNQDLEKQLLGQISMMKRSMR